MSLRHWLLSLIHDSRIAMPLIATAHCPDAYDAAAMLIEDSLIILRLFRR